MATPVLLRPARSRTITDATTCAGNVVAGPSSFIPSADGKECQMPETHCITPDHGACPQLTPLHEIFVGPGKAIGRRAGLRRIGNALGALQILVGMGQRRPAGVFICVHCQSLSFPVRSRQMMAQVRLTRFAP